MQEDSDMPRTRMERKDNHPKLKCRMKTEKYCRDTDCWNCGAKTHKKNQCPHPRSLRCSRCRREGVMTSECSCRQRANSSVSPNMNRIETAVLLTLEGKKVRAVINTGFQDARMGEGVLSFLQSKGPVNLTRRVTKSILGLETLKFTQIRLGPDTEHSYTVECCMDSRVPENELVLGMRTLKQLGYRITVCGSESHERNITTENRFHSQSKERKPDRHREVRDRHREEISFLDRKEAKRVREWFD